MQSKLEQLKSETLLAIKSAKDKMQLEDLENKILGRKSGELTNLLKGLKDLADDARKVVGQVANEVKKEIENAMQTKKQELQSADWGNALQKEKVDITQPALPPTQRGHFHPNTIIQKDLEELFTSMGFMVLDGPELESDYYSFEAVNIPKNHPARDMQDTFYIDKKNKEGECDFVMRPHTSPVQVRAMQKYGAPLRCVVPGRVFRCENIDACHEHTFYQMEGLMVGENISIDNLISVMKELLKGVFKKDMEVRVRPGFFPFVEPGLELDIKCTICGGKGCPSCKNSGWLELLPAGMVHPKVLEYGGIDPKKYSGFAFGLGLTRLAMMKYGVEDIRLFNSGDLRFLGQF